MITTCDDCGSAYDDARRLTYCPHDEFMSEDDLAQKDLAISLCQKPVRFRHQPDGLAHRIQAIGFTGMVTLVDMVGEFAPHLFVEAPS